MDFGNGLDSSSRTDTSMNGTPANGVTAASMLTADTTNTLDE